MEKIVWRMKRYVNLPELTAICAFKSEAQMHDVCFSAIDLIVKATIFKGIPYQRECGYSTNEDMSISFSLKFPSTEKLQEYTIYLETLSQSTNSLK